MTDSKAPELKPCPFCGGEAFVNDDPTGNGGKPHMSGNVGLGRLWSVECDECGADAGFWQDESVAIAAWNTRAELGSGTKPCYAADENYKRCKYSVNRGWCDGAPFLVWDDTGHLFITMGGLKTWDVTDDAKSWFAELGSRTCECIAEYAESPIDGKKIVLHRCSACHKLMRPFMHYCPNCGKRIRKAVER